MIAIPHLTPTEQRLFRAMSDGSLTPQATLIRAMWGLNAPMDDEAVAAVRQNIFRLRKKLAASEWRIENHVGVGYRLVKVEERAA